MPSRTISFPDEVYGQLLAAQRETGKDMNVLVAEAVTGAYGRGHQEKTKARK